MKIIHTFVPFLYAFRPSDDHPDELEKVFDEWEDASFLYEFFEKHKGDISVSIQDAVLKVKRDAEKLKNLLLSHTKFTPHKLNDIFKNLDNNEFTHKPLSQQKARNHWLRLYAIKIDNNNFVITGGAIKLDNQHLMKDQPHTHKELVKLNGYKDFLKDEGVFDSDGFQELIFEL